MTLLTNRFALEKKNNGKKIEVMKESLIMEQKKDKNNDRFQEQEAPLKNTDKAFVQVSRDGSPHMPQSGEENRESDMKPEKTTDMDKR
jgi:hypothetical protein